MANAPIPMPAGAGGMARAKALVTAKLNARQELINKLTPDNKMTNISNATTVRGLTPNPVVPLTKPDPIGNIINQSPAPKSPVQRIIVPGTKTTRGTTITEKKKTVKEVATDIQDPAGPNKPIGKSYREIHHKLEEDEEQLDELLSRRNPHKNTLGALERRETELIRKRSRPFAKEMPGRYFEEEQLDEMPVRLINKALAKNKYKKEKGSRGPHDKWKHENGTTVAVPRHREIADGTARAIFKQAGISEAKQIKQNVIRNLRKKLKAEEAIVQGGRTDTGSAGDTVNVNPKQRDKITVRPSKNIEQGQTR